MKSLRTLAVLIVLPLLQAGRSGQMPKLYRVQDVPSRSGTIAILGGFLIEGTGAPPLDDAAIVIRGDRIEKVGRVGEVEIPADSLRIHADGKTILPGLIDMHVHLNKGDDLQLFLAAGVTSVRDVANFTAQVVPLERRTRSGEILGPRIYFSGESFVHKGGFSPWQRPTKDAAEAREEVRKRIASGASVIKIVNDITPELVEAIVEEAHRAGIPVTADVLGNRLVTAERAVTMGVDGLEHTSGVPQSIIKEHSPVEFSEPVGFNSLLGWHYLDRENERALIETIVKRGTYVVPTFAVLEAESKIPRPSDPADAYLSENLAAFWKILHSLPSWGGNRDAAFLTHFIYSQQFIGRLAAAGGRIAAGTDTPTPGLVPGFSLHRELELLVQAGLTPMQAIQAATSTAARFLGKSGEMGSVQDGKLADVIIVDGAPNREISDIRHVRTVVRGGRVFETTDLLRLSKADDVVPLPQ